MEPPLVAWVVAGRVASVLDEGTDAVSVGGSEFRELDPDTPGVIANNTGTADWYAQWREREGEQDGASLSRFSARFDEGSPTAENGHLAVYSPARATLLEHDVRQDGLGAVEPPPPVSSIYAHCRQMPAGQL
jgi:hypothetical protein